MVLILSEEDVRRALTVKDALKAVEEAFRELGKGSTIMPVRQTMTVKPWSGWVGVMPSYLRSMGALATKIVTVYGNNPVKYGLPTTIATVVLNDVETGKPLSMMGGTYLTALRTGAVGGLAARLLSRRDSKVVGVFGAGMQAEMQIAALSHVRRVEEIKVYSRSFERSAKLAGKVKKEYGVEARAVAEPSLAVSGCDMVVTATTSKTPVFDGKLLADGTHVNLIGAHTPTAREVDSSVILRGKIIVDSREAALKESGDLLIPISEGVFSPDKIYGELGEILVGAKQGRVSKDEITVFKSCGLAVQDAAAAHTVYRRAVEAGLGREVPLW
ncbi:MAG: ornithine cyclodeaminase family protein [Thaumarchaeota archaeon]|nr:ornithine cyclodeaminase family protein [Nitrososphaerota archaeon]